MEIRDQVLKALERKHDINESTIRQARVMLNRQTKTYQQVHREKIKTFAHLKQSLLNERGETRCTAREQMHNIFLMRKKLGVQEREVRLSEVTLNQLIKSEQQLVAQHIQISEQRRMVHEFASLQRSRATQAQEERNIEEINVLALLPKETETNEVGVDQSSVMAPVNAEPLSYGSEITNILNFDLLSDYQSPWSQTPMEQRSHQEVTPDSDRSGITDRERTSKRESYYADKQESDPQLVFHAADANGKSVSVALTLRPERGIEVMLQRSSHQTPIQSQHEARRIERSLNASGLAVADVTVTEIDS